MPMPLCSVCDRIFDASEQVDAQYDPPVCEDCLMQAEEQKNQWWESIDDDPEWIKENL